MGKGLVLNPSQLKHPTVYRWTLTTLFTQAHTRLCMMILYTVSLERSVLVAFHGGANTNAMCPHPLRDLAGASRIWYRNRAS